MKKIDWRYVLRLGLIAGVVVAYVSAIGVLVTFNSRSIVAGVLTLGQLILYIAPLWAGYLVGKKVLADGGSYLESLLSGLGVGVLSMVPVLGLIILPHALLPNLRRIFVNISPDLITLLTFQQESLLSGSLLLVGLMTALGLVGSATHLIPTQVRRPLAIALLWVVLVGMFSELLIQILRPLNRTLVTTFFQGNALKSNIALALFAITAALNWIVTSQRETVKTQIKQLPSDYQKGLYIASLVLVFILFMLLPRVVGSFLSEVLVNVGLYILMGLGLNIAIGLAGLLDLGYVTNFAIGAYIMGVLTSTSSLGRGQLSFWVVIPICIVSAMITGFLLALPVLRMRGDYLAITTLGFGEIIRLLALSDWLRPLIGGAQGIVFIPKPAIFDFVFGTSSQLYYIVFFGCLLVLFVSVRLNNSRTGRQWMALREDEDAAKAMGIDTIQTKLLAFTLSAASGGLAGAIFASKLGTIFPNSFDLLVSINVLALIIVGGMGSIPGIMVGALVLIGLPELLREFAEYRLLAYGVLLIVMMLARPEGLIPSEIRQRELHDEEVISTVENPSA